MIIKCKMCGGDLDFAPGATYGTCQFCGSTSTIPQGDDESKLNRYNRANHFRRQGEFDKAVTAYEKLLEQDDADAEAHWGAVISRYGIEYVQDPATNKRIPTCHRVQVASILADADYLAAVEHAPDAASRDLYKQQAAEIAEIQKGILAISANEKPYDVFICYKETDENGQRTRDSQWAQDVYYGLTEQGYKVFFSRITLEDKLGRQYEPYIFAALNSAKVMVVIGSKPEYFNAVWVKNEWSRYLALMKNDRSRLLIPCYRGMDPYDLPEELSSLQSQDMSKIGFMQDLLRGIRKVLDADTKPEQPQAVQQVAQASPAASGSTAPLLRRVFLFLEDGDWQSADEYSEKVLDIEPENGRAYLGKLMAELKVRSEDKLPQLDKPFDDGKTYQKVIRFGDAAQQSKLKSDNDAIRARIEHNRQAAIYSVACNMLQNAATVAHCDHVRAKLRTIPDFPGVADKLAECDNQQEAIQNRWYSAAVQQMAQAGESSAAWAKAKAAIANHELDGYRDTNELRAQAAKRYDECIAAEKEARRQEEEIARRKAKAAAAKKWRIMILGIAAALVIAVGIYVVIQIIIPGNNYNSAVRLLAAGRYQEASDTFAALGGYKDAAARVNESFYAQGKALMDVGDYDAAIAAFEKANGFSDAATQVMEIKYQQASALNASGKYAAAYFLYNTIRGYKDVDSLLANDPNIAAAVATAKYEAGNYVTFGAYPQTKGGNDLTPIEWLVLARDGSKVLLISRYGLDCHWFNSSASPVTWETSVMRTWLNNTFINKAFTASEQTGILLTEVDNSSSQGSSEWTADSGNSTPDKVFLLSYAEASQYFLSNEARKCVPTGFAIQQGGFTSTNYQLDGIATGWWWLRSTDSKASSAASVGVGGWVGDRSVVSNSGGIVRPALWIDLDSGIF